LVILPRTSGFQIKRSIAMADIPSQLDLYRQILDIQTQVMPLTFQADHVKDQGDLSRANQLYQRLEMLLKEQLRLTELLNQHYDQNHPSDLTTIVRPLCNTLLIQADLVEAMRDLPAAERIRDEASALSQRYLPAASSAQTERQRAGSLIGQGRFNEALSALTNARDQFELSGNLADMAEVTTDIAGLLEWLGDFERARQEAARATKLVESELQGDTVSWKDIASALASAKWETAQKRAQLLKISVELNQLMARVDRYTGRLDEAEQRFTRALNDVMPQIRPAIEVHFAVIANLRGQYQSALAYTDRLLPRMTGLLRPKRGIILRVRAEALLGLGRPQEALPVLDQAIQDLAQFYDPDSLWKMLWLRGRILELLKHEAEALQAYVQATEVVHKLRKSPLGYRLDSTYLADKLPLFTGGIQLAARMDAAADCCQLIEKIKSRILTAAISVPDAERPANSDPLEQQVVELSRQIDLMEYTGYQEGWTVQMDQQHAKLLANRSALLERIRFSDPRWRALSQPVPFDLPRVQQVLGSAQQAALELYYQPGQVITVLVTGSGCQVGTQIIGAETASALDRYLNNLDPQDQKQDPRLFDLSVGLGVTAGQLVPPLLLREALKAKCLVIVPHGPLHLLPWSGLLFEGKRLFEYCPVGVLPSLSCLSAIPAPRSGPPKVALIGSPAYQGLRNLQPLPLAEEEVRTIREIYEPVSGILGAVCSGKEATQAGFWTLAKHPEAAGMIFHIACHGSFDRTDPVNSGLMLEDGKIDAAELSQARLKYDEVILSACSTGQRPTVVQGVALAGDDILGLPGAFLEAGARAVLVSIPPANDAAALRFMTIYHECRAQGMSSLKAFQQAQIEMLGDDGTPVERWIGFTMYGHGGETSSS
jgi:CHAT domain-containing protein/tetratricopeptide (TPR) repeat protein